jgi:uncharacterized protein YmfQ (DUF2313 family)
MIVPSGILDIDLLGDFMLGGPAADSLEEMLPSGVTVWVGLFTVLPVNGAEAVEASVPRQPLNRWVTHGDRRKSAKRVAWEIAVPEQLEGVGVFEGETGDILLGYCELQLEVGMPRPLRVNVGDTVAILPHELVFQPFDEVANETVVDISNNSHQLPTLQHYPSGDVWTKAIGLPLAKIAAAIGREFSRVTIRVRHMIDESDPRTTVEELPAWEKFAGLPDDPTSPPTSLADRRAALASKSRRRAEFEAATLVEMAETMGYSGVEVFNMYRPFRAGISAAGDPVGGGDWTAAFTIRTNESLPAMDASLRAQVLAITPPGKFVFFELGSP